MRAISLSLFFPAYNEEENIRDAVRTAVETLDESPYIEEYEIIVVNDGSSDRTGDIVRKLAREYPAVRAVEHNGNRGYGEALKSGIEAARMEYVFFTDADLQFDILELQNLLVHLKRYPVVIGYRAPRRDPFLRLLNAKGWNYLNRFFFGLSVRDIDCAFKVFRRDLIQRISLASSGAMINAELLIKLFRAGVPIKQVPVSHLPRTKGSPTGAKLSVIWRAFREMAGLYGGELGSVTHKQAMKFGAVGIFNTLLDLGVYLALTRLLPFFAASLVMAKFSSFLIGTVSSLLLNRYWTFGVTAPIRLSEIVRFYMTVSAGLSVNVTTMYFMVYGLGLYDLVALIVATVLTFAVNFTLSKVWVFKTETGRRPKLARTQAS